jgi:fatty acid elongase 3
MSLATFLQNNIPNPLPSYLTSYQPGKTPLSTAPVVFSVLAGYLATIFTIQGLMKSHAPMTLKFWFQLHNIILSAGSGLLLVLMVEEVAPIWWKHGLFHAICNDDSWTPRLEFYYMVNYYIKYVELIDTVFLALKKKPLAFLHVFHHSATALLCYTQLNGRTTVSWVPIILNLAVHVLMYYYYYATAGGRRIWWKKYLTTMQIVQFVIDLFAVYFASYNYFAYTYFPHMPTLGSCSGTESAASFGCLLLTSYLGLFIDFYIRTYKKAPAGGAKKANGSAHANGKANGKAH